MQTPADHRQKVALQISNLEYALIADMSRECGLAVAHLILVAIARGLPIVSSSEKAAAYKARRRKALNVRRNFCLEFTDDDDLQPSDKDG